MEQDNSTKSKFPSSGLIGFFSGEQIAKFLPCILIVGSVFILCSILAWPYLIRSIASPDGTETLTGEFCQKLLFCGLIGCAVAALVISIRACSVNSDYTVESSFSWCYTVCLATIWVAMVCFRLNPLGASAHWMLVLMVMGLIGIVISFVPSIISMLIGIVARIIRKAMLRHW